jgi:hypothetical protein
MQIIGAIVSFVMLLILLGLGVQAMRAARPLLFMAGVCLALGSLSFAVAYEFWGKAHLAGEIALAGSVALFIGPEVARNLRRSVRRFIADARDDESSS